MKIYSIVLVAKPEKTI